MKTAAKDVAAGRNVREKNIRKRRRTPQQASEKQVRVEKSRALPNGATRLRAMIEASVDCVITIDAQSTIIEFNTAAEETFGYRRDEVIGRSLPEKIIPPSLREAHRRGMAALLQGGASKLLGRRVEMPGMRSDGSEFPVELTVIQIPGQTPPIFTAYLRDITERKRDEHKLRESEARFRLMFEKSGVGMALATIDSIFLQVNAVFCALLGRTEEEVVGHNTAEFTHPDDLEKTLKPDPKVREDGAHIVDLEKRYVRKDGATVWAHVTSVLHLDEDAQPLYWIAIVEDITERKRAEEKLWHSLNLLRAITEGTSDAIFAKDRAGRYLMVNTATANLLGKKREEIVGLDDTHLFAAETAARIVTRDRVIMESGETRSDEDTTTTQNGVSRVLLTTKGPLLDHAGNVMGVFGVSRDITERKREEQSLRESQSRYEALVQSIDGIVWEADPQTFVFTFVSRQAEKILGYPLERWFEGPSFWPDHMHPADRDWAVKFCVDATARGEDHQFEYRMISADGRVVWLNDIVSLHIAPDQSVILRGLMVDITERKQADQALRESEARIRLLVKSSNVGLWDWNLLTNDVFFSPEWKSQLGYGDDEVPGRYEEWESRLHPEDREASLRAVKDFREGRREDYDIEFRLRHKDGSWRSILTRADLIRDAAGQPVRMLGCHIDITERKQAEQALKKAEEQYRSIFNNAVDGIFRTSPDGRFLIANPAAARIFGFASPEELIEERRDIARQGYVDPRRREEFKRLLQEQGAVNDFEYEAYRKDGSRVWICENTRAVHAPSGEILYFEGIFEDVTDRKRAEEALYAQALRYKTLTDTSTDSIYVLDEKGELHEANAAFLRRRGYAAAEVKGLNVADWDARWTREQLQERLRKLAGSSAVFETRHRCKDGSIFDVEVCATGVEIDGEQLIFCVTRDITERKRTEQAQERGLSLMLATLESTADGILVVNTKGKIVAFNRLFARMWRLSEEVLASKEDARALQCVLDQLIEPNEFLEKVHHLYRHPEQESFDRLVFKDGRIFERYSRPQLIGGEVAGRVWSFRDVTERRLAAKALEEANRQLRTLSGQLFHMQEEERRHLARELHDEIGQSLTAAKINLKIIAPDVPAHATGRLGDSIELLDQLLRQVRQLSLDLHPSLLDDLGLAPALRSLIDQQAHRAGLRTQFFAPEPFEHLDSRIQITGFRIAQEAITNVLRHAKAQFVDVHLQTDASELRMRIVDDGIGFDLAEVERRAHEGAGFGLMGMRERAALVGGSVQITSSPGEGTTVEVFLPLGASGEIPG